MSPPPTKTSNERPEGGASACDSCHHHVYFTGEGHLLLYYKIVKKTAANVRVPLRQEHDKEDEKDNQHAEDLQHEPTVTGDGLVIPQQLVVRRLYIHALEVKDGVARRRDGDEAVGTAETRRPPLAKCPWSRRQSEEEKRKKLDSPPPGNPEAPQRTTCSTLASMRSTFSLCDAIISASC